MTVAGATIHARGICGHVVGHELAQGQCCTNYPRKTNPHGN